MNNIEIEDKISFVVIALGALGVVFLILTAWSNPNNALGHMFKSTFNQIKCESMDGDGAKCAAYQRQTGKCAWYGACNKCSKTGQVESQLCAVSKTELTKKEPNNPKPSDEKKEVANVNCSEFDDNVDACIEAQRNGSKCAWYSGCKLCIREGSYSDADFLKMCQDKTQK